MAKRRIKKITGWKNQLRELVERREIAEDRSYPQTRIERETGIPQETLSRYMRNLIRQYDMDTVTKLMNWLGITSLDEFFKFTIEEEEDFQNPVNADASLQELTVAGIAAA